MPRPELGPVKVGDELILIPATNRYHPRQPLPVTVTKVGRVWVHLTSTADGGRAQTWEMRMDTQDGGSHYSDVDRFATAEQLAWEQRMQAVDATLREAKVDIRHESAWRDEDRRIALANFLRTYDGQPEL